MQVSWHSDVLDMAAAASSGQDEADQDAEASPGRSLDTVPEADEAAVLAPSSSRDAETVTSEARGGWTIVEPDDTTSPLTTSVQVQACAQEA